MCIKCVIPAGPLATAMNNKLMDMQLWRVCHHGVVFVCEVTVNVVLSGGSFEGARCSGHVGTEGSA